MAHTFLYFLFYSFLGYGLEKLFARVTHSSRQVRKCFLLLPLCPVYGLAMLTVLTLTDPSLPFWVHAVIAGTLCTAVEYLVHLFYDKVFKTKFWDYSSLSVHVGGRICPHFALIWGILSTVASRHIHPVAALCVSAVPSAAVFAIGIVLAADCILTSIILHRYHDTERLSVSALLTQM